MASDKTSEADSVRIAMDSAADSEANSEADDENIEGKVPDYKGHRARLRKRLLATDGEGLADYELLEYLLSTALPRRDTKPLAKRLLREFNNLAELVSADPETLRRVDGMGDSTIAALKIVQATALRLAKGRILNRPILSHWTAVLDWLRSDMGTLPIERVRVLYLNSANILIRSEIENEGSIDRSSIYVRNIIKRALELHATAIMVVHNHPSGNPEPSQQDINITREIAQACKSLNIYFHDHLIIGNGEKYFSFRDKGLL